jgi:DNA-binding response OmpR family regulator
MMPGMSGLEVCRAIRSDPGIEHTRIIITSAKGQTREQKEGLEAGADRYLTKPFEITTLLETVEELVTQ